MAYQQNDDVDRQEPFEHDWLCAVCFKTVSSTRPPTFNPDNCSCSEVGTPINDPSQVAQVHGLGIAMNGLGLNEHSPPSYPTSDDGSIITPDGPEARDPNNHYLPLAPAVGLGEAQHRRRASFDLLEDELSFSIRRYLRSLPQRDRAWQNGLEDSSSGWLRQDTYLGGPIDSVKATRGRGSGSGSVMVSSEHSGGSSGLKSLSIDPLTEMGAWADGEWPMEIDEYAIEGDLFE